MPELPDITVYMEALTKRAVGHPLEAATLHSMFVLRTVSPSIDQFVSCRLLQIRRVGKRLAFQFDDDLWLVIHLMVAGRLQWRDTSQKPAARKAIATFTFTTGSLSLTEAGTRRRASLHLFASEADMLTIDSGGLNLSGLTTSQFKKRLTRRNHTLKRALTDPSIFSGIGNAYSDEILHHARLSPIKLTDKLTADEISQLFTSCKHVLTLWTKQLRTECGADFPSRVTAFRDGMAAHGRYRQPCPDCGTDIQRIRYKSNETNYCPRCQTGGKILADRSLSRLLKQDWPATIEALEELRNSEPQ